MAQYNIFVYETGKIGKIAICEKENYITNIIFENMFEVKKQKFPDFKIIETPEIKKAYAQIAQYFKGERKFFEFKINPVGTDFQKKVWTQLVKIEFGTTKTYAQIAQEVENPRAARAVGNANNKNPIPIVIPCHRVVGKNGSLTGFAGGLDVKQILLDIEQQKKLV